MKKPAFIFLKSRQENYTVAINSDDIKAVIIRKKTAYVHTTNHTLTVDVDDAQLDGLEKSIRSRYHIVHLSDVITLEKTRDAYTAILKIVYGSETTYIWPNGLSTVTVRDDVVRLGVFSFNTLVEAKLKEVPSIGTVTEMFSLLNIH